MRTRPARSVLQRSSHASLGRWLVGLVTTVATLMAASLASAQGSGGTTHAEFDLSQRERVAGSEIIYTDDNPGHDDADTLLITGSTTGVFGGQDIRIEAEVTSTSENLVRLAVEGEHAFALTGTNKSTDVWLEGDSTMLASATITDSLSLSGISGSSVTLELYFQLRGMAEALILIDPGFADLSYAMNTQIELSVTTSAPHSGGGTHTTSIVWPGGYLPSSLDEQKFLDEVVTLNLDVDPSQPIPLEITLQIEPTTNLSNFVEAGTLNANGLHRPSLWDNAAELLGIVVKDSLGIVVPGAAIASSSGYDYPVEVAPPPPHPASNVILSPVAVADNDLGESSPTQAPFTQMLDQSGLTVPFTSGQTGFDVYFSQPNALRSEANFTNNWQSLVSFTLPLTGFVDFDLGAVYPVDRMAIWNLSLEDIRVLVSENPTGPFTEVGAYTLANHINSFSYNAEILDFGSAYDARYVRLQVDSAYLLDPGFTYAIVGEVAVSALTVPEPGSALMAGWGVLGLIVAARARRRANSMDFGLDKFCEPARTGALLPQRDRQPANLA